MPNIYFLDRDGLEYYHNHSSVMFLGKKYDIVFTGDYNVNQTTSAKLVLSDELTVSIAQTGIEFPTVSCVATVTADSGYEAGTATVTKSGNTFTVNVSSATQRPPKNVIYNFIFQDVNEEDIVAPTWEIYTIDETTGNDVMVATGTSMTATATVPYDATTSIVHNLGERFVFVYDYETRTDNNGNEIHDIYVTPAS